MQVTRPANQGKRRTIRRFRIAVTSGPGEGAQWREPHERCAIGSHPSNDLVVDDPTVSRFHCELVIAGDRVRVRDLGSRNGTVAAGIMVADGSIGAGTTLVLGHTELRVELDAGQAYEVARRQAIDAFERDYVTALLDRADGNVARAARDAGVNRAYLHRLLRRHGLR